MRKKNLKNRLNFAIKATEVAGCTLLKLRKWKNLCEFNKRGEAKSFADLISEKIIISLIKTFYPGDLVLSEEDYERNKKFVSAEEFWVLDPLDGTASYCQDYNGFCVQMAYIKNKKPVLGVVHAPITGLTYWASIGRGAYLKKRNKIKKLILKKRPSLIKTYVESRPQRGVVAKILKRVKANRFLELGSYGLKICKVAEGKADIFLKQAEFKIWDTAPGDLILKEAGGRLTLWNGEEIDYSGKKIYFKNLIAASLSHYKEILPYL